MLPENVFELWMERSPLRATAAVLVGPCTLEARALLRLGFDIPAEAVLAAAAERFQAVADADFGRGPVGPRLAADLRFFAAHWRGLQDAVALEWSSAWRLHASAMAPVLEVALLVERAFADAEAYTAWAERFQREWSHWHGARR